FDMSGFVDYISKDGNMYLLLENLGISGEATQDLQDMIDTLDTIAQQNNYISFPADASYDESLALIQQYFSLLNPDSIIADMEDMMSQALLKAYEKRGDKIILVPTQYACDQGKILGKRFDPFYDDETCSPGQYQDLVEEFLSEDMQVYMIMDGPLSQFGIDMQDSSSYTNIVLSYDDIRIREVSMTSQPKDGSYPGFNLSYVYGSHFDVIWEMEQEAWSGKDSFELSWKSELSSRNTLEKGTFKMDFDTAFMSAVADVQIDNGQIIGYTGVFDGNQTLMFEMQSAGSYKGAAFELKNTFTFPQNPLQVSTPSIEYVDQEIEGADCYENYYDGDSEYICYTYPELKEESLDGNFDIQIDTGSGKNNLDVVFDMSVNDDTFFEMKMKNTGKRKFQKKEIQAPRSSVPYEEVFGEDFSY
ncbi:hypothetical protein MK079_05490, partial [Candidatus Gracilibacteria bacterium]|nr:hypothetical protein [Candidatus Gracilibacteria bacterium]